MRPGSLTTQLAMAAAAIAVCAALPWLVPPFYVRVLLLFFMSATLAAAWNILGGLAGYWSFGHAAFFGMGAFAAAHIANGIEGGTSGPAGMLLPLAGATLVCALFAAAIAYPVLRLRGIYFAIAMLGVSQVMSELVNNIDWLGGGVGLSLSSPVPPGVRPERFYYFMFGGLLTVTLALTSVIRRSRLGYGLIAIREDEDTAKMLGVPTEQFKLAAFVISAIPIGLAGAVYGFSLGYMSTTSVFRLDVGLNMIVFCIIGGVGTLWGPLLGTGVMMFITQVLLSRFLDIHLLITGSLVVVMILLLPGGILGADGGWIRRIRGASGRTGNSVHGKGAA